MCSTSRAPGKRTGRFPLFYAQAPLAARFQARRVRLFAIRTALRRKGIRGDVAGGAGGRDEGVPGGGRKQKDRTGVRRAGGGNDESTVGLPNSQDMRRLAGLAAKFHSQSRPGQARRGGNWAVVLKEPGRAQLCKLLDQVVEPGEVDAARVSPGSWLRLPVGRPTAGLRVADEGECALRHAERSEEHTSELQSRPHLVCRLLLEKK